MTELSDMPTYEATIERTFSAAHALRLPNGEMEKLHGHNWHVRLTVASPDLDPMETVMDFHELEVWLDELVALAHNDNLNEIPPFADEDGALRINPSAERVAWWLGTEISSRLPKRVSLVSVSVGEAPGCTATYRPD
jgi:6-pyruvoyltetrahydropterin/6-carboxytetrahydropterin synthase